MHTSTKKNNFLIIIISFFKLSIIPRFNILLCDKFTIIMKFYKLIIFIGMFMSINAQFTDVFVNIDYSNINENEMFIFENFDEEITNYFLNHYFFDAKEDLDLVMDIKNENLFPHNKTK